MLATTIDSCKLVLQVPYSRMTAMGWAVVLVLGYVPLIVQVVISWPIFIQKRS